MSRPVRLGLRENAAQFWLLVALNALVGAMVGLERSVLPLVGRQEFGVTSQTALLTFVLAFGAAKAVANLLAGGFAERAGRRRVLVMGWLLALPVPALIGLAPNWGWIVAANLLLGANQGLAWSMTVNMKIDLVGERRRGLALGLNESAGYLGVAVAAFASGALAASFAPRDVVWIGASVVAVAGVTLAATVVRDTSAHVALEQRSHGGGPVQSLRTAFARGSRRDSALVACSQAGLVNNLNDALAWGLIPLYLAAHGAEAGEIGAVAALYPAVWGLSQVGSGWLSDHVGRARPIAVGMLLQAAALGLMLASDGRLAPALGAAALLGFGTALAYPTLIAAVSDTVSPIDRSRAIGVYRFWRDIGLVGGALLAGTVADAAGQGWAIGVVAAITAASGAWVAAVRPGRLQIARSTC